jgi:site-specific DNA recombinase
MVDRQLRAVLYARKSSKMDRQEEQSASVTDQLDQDRAYAIECGWAVVGEFSDDGRSGLLDRTKRPGLDAVLKVIESGDADVLVTLWTSRLSREERQRAEMLDVLDFLGVEWHAIADGGRIDRSTYAGYVSYGIHTLFDVAYSKRVGDNWRRAHEKRLEAGLPKSTSPRFGYTYLYDSTDSGRRVNGRYVINEAESEVVRELYRRYATGGRGEGFTQLVKWLNDGGWRVKGTGSAWSVRTLSRFMDSGFAAGFISREADLRDVKGSHEAIISEQGWLAYSAQREKQAALGRKASGAGERWWLAGLVKCGECGGSMYVDSFVRTSSSVYCSRRRGDPAACKGMVVLRSYCEIAVGLWLGGQLDAIERLSEAEGEAGRDAIAAAYQAAVAARDRVADGLANLEVNRALGEIEAGVYRRARDTLSAQLKTAEENVKHAAVALESRVDVDVDLLRGAIDRGWSGDERAALHAVLGRVEVGRDALTIVPVTGEPVIRTRAELTPRCGVSGCGRIHYTHGLCKSHTMRARSLGGEALFLALVARVAEVDGITVEQVEAVFPACRDGAKGPTRVTCEG